MRDWIRIKVRYWSNMGFVKQMTELHNRFQQWLQLRPNLEFQMKIGSSLNMSCQLLVIQPWRSS